MENSVPSNLIQLDSKPFLYRYPEMSFEEFLSRTFQERAIQLENNDLWIKEKAAELKARKPKETTRGSFLLLAIDPYWAQVARELFETDRVDAARATLVWYSRIFN